MVIQDLPHPLYHGGIHHHNIHNLCLHDKCQVEIDHDRDREGLGRCLAGDTAVDAAAAVIDLSKADIAGYMAVVVAADWMRVFHLLSIHAGSRLQRRLVRSIHCLEYYEIFARTST